MAVEQCVIEKRGAWLSYGKVRLGQGRENAKNFLGENRDLTEEIRNAVVAKGLPAVAAVAKEPGNE